MKYFSRLQRMAEFIIDVTKPNGQVIQIGDNDSGRLFKLQPNFYNPDLAENHLQHHTTVAALNGLFARSDLSGFAGRIYDFETQFVSCLASTTPVNVRKSDDNKFQFTNKQVRDQDDAGHGQYPELGSSQQHVRCIHMLLNSLPL